MGFTDLATLVVLALIDSTSFGTLLIPIWLLMAPGRIRLSRILFFLITVVGSYFLLGLVLLAGANTLLDIFEGIQDTRPFLIAQIALGVGLVVISERMDNKRARARAAQKQAAGTGRIGQWRSKAMGSDSQEPGSVVGVMLLALGAVVVEIATMLPYLAAIGIISSEDQGAGSNAVLLGLYCLVMIGPALVFTTARVLAGSALDKPLRSIETWLSRNARSTTAWVIGIVGVLIGIHGIGGL